MWGNRYWGRYWGDRYWGSVGAAAATPSDIDVELSGEIVRALAMEFDIARRADIDSAINTDVDSEHELTGTIRR